MKRYVFTIAFIIMAAFISTNVYAADMPGQFDQGTKPADKKENKKDAVTETAKLPAPEDAAAAISQSASAAVTPRKKLTRAETITRINEILMDRPNTVSKIQGLKIEQSGGYTYNGKKIEELDEEALIRLLALINRQASMDNLQKIDRQQRMVENLQRIDRINRPRRAVTEPPSAPKIYTPPRAPRTQY